MFGAFLHPIKRQHILFRVKLRVVVCDGSMEMLAQTEIGQGEETFVRSGQGKQSSMSVDHMSAAVRQRQNSN